MRWSDWWVTIKTASHSEGPSCDSQSGMDQGRPRWDQDRKPNGASLLAVIPGFARRGPIARKHSSLFSGRMECTSNRTAMKTAGSRVPLTRNIHLVKWVEKTAELTKPKAIHWVDGSKAEYDKLCREMVASGSLTKLNEELWPGCY